MGIDSEKQQGHNIVGVCMTMRPLVCADTLAARDVDKRVVPGLLPSEWQPVGLQELPNLGGRASEGQTGSFGIRLSYFQQDTDDFAIFQVYGAPTGTRPRGPVNRGGPHPLDRFSSQLR